MSFDLAITNRNSLCCCRDNDKAVESLWIMLAWCQLTLRLVGNVLAALMGAMNVSFCGAYEIMSGAVVYYWIYVRALYIYGEHNGFWWGVFCVSCFFYLFSNITFFLLDLISFLLSSLLILFSFFRICILYLISQSIFVYVPIPVPYLCLSMGFIWI